MVATFLKRPKTIAKNHQNWWPLSPFFPSWAISDRRFETEMDPMPLTGSEVRYGGCNRGYPHDFGNFQMIQIGMLKKVWIPQCIADFQSRDPRGFKTFSYGNVSSWQHLGDFEFGKEDKLLNCGVSNGGSNPLVDISWQPTVDSSFVTTTPLCTSGVVLMPLRLLLLLGIDFAHADELSAHLHAQSQC